MKGNIFSNGNSTFIILTISLLLINGGVENKPVQNRLTNVKSEPDADRVNAFSPDQGWAIDWGPRSGGYMWPYDIAVNRAGEIYVTGAMGSEIDFDPAPGDDNVNIINARGAFLVKYDPNENFMWYKTWGSDSDVEGKCVVVDDDGNVYVGGVWGYIVDFDPGPEETIAQFVFPTRNDDCFLSKFDADGNFIWVRTWCSSKDDWCHAVAVDHAGNVYAGGNVGSSAIWQMENKDQIDSSGPGAGYIVCFNSRGEFQWVREWTLGTVNWNSGVVDMAVGPENEIFAVGSFMDEINFGAPDTAGIFESKGFDDAFLVRLDQSGDIDWVKVFGGPYRDSIETLQIENSGSLLIAGGFSSNLDFDPGPGEYTLEPEAWADGFICRLTLDGDFVKAASWGGRSNDWADCLSIDSSGNIFVSGQFTGSVDFAPGDRELFCPDSGSIGVFLTKLDPELNLIWADTWSGGGMNLPRGIDTDAFGNCYLIAEFGYYCDLDPSDIIYRPDFSYMVYPTSFGGLVKVLPNGAWAPDEAPELLVTGTAN